ncbi:MAG TPA: phosphoglycerate mutase family protein [Thermoanaerobaculia bacterium]|jgi:broad specificity phosphatase PhoE|nr:phosphoglycerate mutase family protein [Thermoanaerobaculia bacterium]
MKRIALIVLAAVCLATSLAAAPNPVTTVILVRHAEKANQEDESPLTPAGTERAKELARVLGSLKIDAVYTTQFRRTKDTGAPTAEAKGLTAIVRNTGPTYAADLAKHIRANHAGQTVLVVGHSNTTIHVMAALGATGLPEIPESEYDNLFVLTDAPGAAPKVVALRFGAAVR